MAKGKGTRLAVCTLLDVIRTFDHHVSLHVKTLTLVKILLHYDAGRQIHFDSGPYELKLKRNGPDMYRNCQYDENYDVFIQRKLLPIIIIIKE